jgi:ubiquinone/menaquinone biosynthesis C-methylase UbiE
MKNIVLNLENKLPFPNNHFDCCSAAEIIEHINNVEKLLGEIYRVLKPNGYLILTTPNRSSLIAKFDRLIGRFMSNGEWKGHDFKHVNIYDSNKIKKIIEDAEFKIIKSESFYLFYGLPLKSKLTLGMCTWILAKKL